MKLNKHALKSISKNILKMESFEIDAIDVSDLSVLACLEDTHFVCLDGSLFEPSLQKRMRFTRKLKKFKRFMSEQCAPSSAHAKIVGSIANVNLTKSMLEKVLQSFSQQSSNCSEHELILNAIISALCSRIEGLIDVITLPTMMDESTSGNSLAHSKSVILEAFRREQVIMIVCGEIGQNLILNLSTILMKSLE